MPDSTPLVSLLETILVRAGYEKLSDLHTLPAWRLSAALQSIPADAFPAQEWDDAAAYLAGIPPTGDARRAREKLLESWRPQNNR